MNKADLTPVGVSVERIAQAMSQWRLMVSRRYIGRTALEKAAPDLSLASLDVIEAVHRLSAAGEATVGAVADMINIDPSRSSRMVAELVERGMLRRAVSQADGRRAVVELGDKSNAFFQEKRRVQRELIGGIVKDWPADELAQFSGMLERFVEGLEVFTRTK